MRVSGEECLRISQLRPTDRVVSAVAMGTLATASVNPGAVATVYRSLPSVDREGLDVAMSALAGQPDVREQVVSSLRERIESGAYFVSGEQIAEMMIRRQIADHVR
ncbi:MAG: flagellar biosynthesis anti-sigma factor FlgM [Cytophagales bacterium]|nr:flagellar biosynthesis anti-sigma factor FlgM [Armatimonadota bacterium]